MGQKVFGKIAALREQLLQFSKEDFKGSLWIEKLQRVSTQAHLLLQPRVLSELSGQAVLPTSTRLLEPREGVLVTNVLLRTKAAPDVENGNLQAGLGTELPSKPDLVAHFDNLQQMFQKRQKRGEEETSQEKKELILLFAWLEGW